MNARRSKKLLIGLGSTIAFSSVGFVAGVGIKSIITTNNNQPSFLQEKSVEEIPKFNTADGTLFPIDTSKFAREMHFGNTWRGQTLTPWGWLGVGNGDTYSKATIFLTAWNGEILWINEYDRNLGNADSFTLNPVYDMKYDFNSDRLFVIRSAHANGLFGKGASKFRLDIIEGSTGRQIKSSPLSWNQVSTFANKAEKFLKQNFESKNQEHLFTLDVVSSNKDDNTVYLTYSPNLMQLSEKNPASDGDKRQIVSMETVLANWADFQLVMKFDVKANTLTVLDQSNIWGGDNNSGGNSSRRDILWKNSSGKWEYKYYDEKNNENKWFATNASLLTNPFNTISEEGHLITHFIFADNKGNTFHLYYGNKNTGNSNWTKYVGSERLAKEGEPDKSDVQDVHMPVLNENGKFYWSNILRWESRAILNANTRINRNMFEPNSVTFAYPYAASHTGSTEVVPAYNVASIMIDYKTGKIKTDKFAKPFLKSVVYQIGKQAFEYWEKNKSKYPSNRDLQELYPWPDNSNDPNWLVKFNRLISVSPFDNTIIFASTSPFRGQGDIKLDKNNKNKYASFWIGTNQIILDNGTKGKLPLMRPFLVSNLNGGTMQKKAISSKMINGSGNILENLYNQGFTFDLSSLTLNPDGTNTKLNLYFTHTGSYRNGTYQYPGDDGTGLVTGPMRTSKIGLLDSPFYNEANSGDFKNSWASGVDQIFGNSGTIPHYTAQITDENFASLIHSRAKIDEWWKRSWFNVNNAANALKFDGKQLNPIYKNDNDHPVSYAYNKNLKNPVLKTNASTELLSNWKTGGANFNRLEVKQGLLKVINKSEKNKLFLELSFSPSDSISRNKYMAVFHENDTGIQDRKRQRLFWKKEVEIFNPSYQIFSSWSNHVKVSGLTTSITNLEPALHWYDNNLVDWIDARQKPNEASFGNSNNSQVNNTRGLRVVFRIKNPATSNKPDWWNPDQKFFQWYPVSNIDLLSGETLFKTIVTEFIKWKNQNINLNYGSTKSQGLGLANLTIEAGLQLNPKINSNANLQDNQIYKISDNRFLILDKNSTNVRMVIYDDGYKGNRVVYKQEEKEYTNLNKGGFKSPDLNQSWTTDGLSGMKNSTLKAEANIDNLKDWFVRPSPDYKDPVIKAKYTDQTKKQIKIELANLEQKGWFDNVFNSYNFGLNLFAQFEYATKTDPNKWVAFQNQSSNNNYVIDTANASNTGWTFNVSQQDIIKVRYRLIESPTKNQFNPNSNDFVEWKNFNANDKRLISTEASIQDKFIKLESSWITNEKLVLTNGGTLDQITTADVTSYEDKIIKKIATGNPNNPDLNETKLKDILEFQYFINDRNTAGMINLSSGQLVNKLHELLNARAASDDGAFSLWDENKSDKTKIHVKVKVKDKHINQYVLIDDKGVEQPTGIGKTVRVNIPSKIDLSKYFEWLKNQKLVATKTAEGEMNQVQIGTSDLGQGLQFSNRTFEQMKNILANVGIKFVFKQWDKSTNGWSSNWNDDLSSLNNYNVADPAIMVGLQLDQNFNIHLWVGNKDMTNSISTWSGIQVKLQLPKTVTIDIQKIKDEFIKDKPIKGDTHKVDISGIDSFIEKQIDQIIQTNASGNNGAFDNLKHQLKFKFKLGQSSNWQEASQLSQWIEQQNQAKVDINNNELWIKIELDDPNKTNEFEIPNLATLETKIYEDDNEEIKKWIHGEEFESALDSITVTGDKTHISYNYPEKINQILQNVEERVILQWADATTNRNDDWKNVATDQPPTDVNNGAIKKIKFKISLNPDKQSFLYGPEQLNNQKIKEIDLSNLKTLVKINPNWFKENLVVETEIIKIHDNTFLTKLKEWEQKVLKKIENTDQSIINKVKIRYDFLNEFDTVNSDELINGIKNKINKNEDIVQLWDGTTNDGDKIQAKFVVDQADQNLIQFVDENDQVIDYEDEKLKGDVNTKNIQTDVNLINYMDLLTKEEIEVIPAQNATLGQINGIKPPLNNRDGLFSNKTWDEISNNLESKKVKILFSKDAITWNSAKEIKEYDPNKATLNLAIENKSSNLNIQYKQGTSEITPNQDSKNNPLIVKLKVTKLINIKQDDWDEYLKKPEITGDTKRIKIEQNPIDTIIQKIKQRHVTESGNPEFQRANISLKFSLDGSNKNYMDPETFKKYLSSQTKDQTTRILYGKFFIEKDSNQEWQLSGVPEFQLFKEDNSNPLKIFIHDDGIFTKLSKPSVSGNNNDLKWNWNGLTIDSTSGIIKDPNKNNALKVEYSIDKKSWTTNQISKVPTGTKEIWIKLSLTDPNRFIYEQPNSIGQEIKVDLSNIKQILNVLTKSLATIDLSTTQIDISILNNSNFTDWESRVKNQMMLANGSIPDWQNLIEFEYQLQDKFFGNKWFNSTQLIAKLKEWQNSNSNDTFGILQLWNQADGKKILTRLKLKNDQNSKNYELKVDNINPLFSIKVVKTNNIFTTINFAPVYNWLKQIKLDISRTSDHGFSNISWPNVSVAGSKFHNKTWDQVSLVLQKLNVETMYQDVDKDDKPKTWTNDYHKMNSFGSNATFNMKFSIKDPTTKGKNIKLKLSDNETIDAANKESKVFEVSLKAPKFIKLDATLINDFKNKNVVSGNTKYLTVDNSLVKDLIKNIKDKNQNISNIADANLKVFFAIGQNPSFNEWFEPEYFAEQIKKVNKDQNSNQVNITFWVENENPIEPDFITDSNPIILKSHTNPDQVDQAKGLKYFINDAQWEKWFDSIRVFGTTENLIWNWGNPLTSLINLTQNATLIKTNSTANHLGLHFEWTTNPNASEKDPEATGTDLTKGWTKTKPYKIDSGINKVWIRAVAQSGFVYGPAESTTNTPMKKHEIDLSKIKKIIKLESTWLQKINATGDLINLILNEDAARKLLSDNKVLPEDELDNLIFEYSIDEKNWKDKDQFQKFLVSNDGKGVDGFILKRNDIKVRFGLKQGISDDKYGFIIDNKLIQDPDAFKAHYKLLIDDINSINTTVIGVINTKFLAEFTVDNFAIFGSNNRPRLNIKKEPQLLSLLNPYSSSNFFKIEITTTYDESKKIWDWKDAKEIWKNGKFINDLASLSLSIPTNKKVAIRLLAIDSSKYKVKNDNYSNLTDQKILDISKNVHITFEIENPFFNANKSLAIWTRDDNKKAKWNQGEGQFRIVVQDLKNPTIPPDLTQDATQFLESSSEPNKDKLELVYKLFENEPTQEEIDHFKKPGIINRFDDPNGWKTFEFKKDKIDNHDWSQGLKLKVGNFLMVGLRVKKEYAMQSDPFVLKDNQHSILIPVVSDTKKPGRVSGFKINPDQIPIIKSSIQLESTKENLQGGYLDGYTLFKNLTLEDDGNSSIDGVKLKLELFNDFYRDQTTKKILVSASGSKLIKRDTSGTQGPQYVDEQGNGLTDEAGKPIYMYTDPKTKRLTKPTESTSVTRSKELTELSNGNFMFPIINDEDQMNEFSLFRNQKVAIVYEAKEGLKLDGLADFELLKSKTEDLQNTISPQIKFPVENPANVSYFWKYEDFANNILEYESSVAGIDETISGFSKVKTPLKIERITNGQTSSVTASTGVESAKVLEQMLKTDFSDQLQFSYSYLKKSGSETTTNNSANIYNLDHLENGDKIILTIESKENDLIYTEAPNPLILNVEGLLTEAPKPERLQFLRVEQKGILNGEGSFRLLVNDPSKPDTNDSLLKGWKFLIRVWDKNKKDIKIHWTDDQTNLVHLSNGDKVEWKLVDQKGNPVRDAYYNTIAGDHIQDPQTGDIIYKFQEVNYNNGPTNKTIIKDDIGKYPPKSEENKYPENSGFVIGGLKEKILRFDLTQLAFEKILTTLGPFYKGVNGHGVLNFNPKFFNGQWWINHDGDVYQKDLNLELKSDKSETIDQPNEITLEQFFANTTFYNDNPATNPFQVGWNFGSNETAVDNHLSNKNQIWARFDVIQREIDSNQNSEEKFLIAMLPPVSNLQIITDPMSPLWWVLISLGIILSLGILSTVLLIKRHKKLKVPKLDSSTKIKIKF